VSITTRFSLFAYFRKIKRRNNKWKKKNQTIWKIKFLNKKRRIDGITLIALVITIIVILILVAVTVRTSINSGLFGHASTAAKRWEEEQENEINIINGAADKIDEISNSKPEFTNIRILSKTADTAIIGATAIDRDNEKLTYILYFGDNKEALQQKDSIINIQGEEVTWTVPNLNETTKYFYRIEVKDRFATVSSEVKELRRSPYIENTVVEKTTNSATIKVTGKGEPEVELTYNLYLGKTEEDMEKTQTKTGRTDEEISFEELNLEEYTDYYYRIEISDGTETNKGNVQTFRTYCPGTGLECAGGELCSACQGTGKCLSDFFAVDIVGSQKWRCRYCGQLSAVYADVFCATCTKSLASYPELMQEPGIVDYCTNCRRVRGTDIPGTDLYGHGECNTCKGSKYKTLCEHGKNAPHEYCSHGQTTQHDT